MKRYIYSLHSILVAVSLLFDVSASAQQTSKTFNVMTLNVDGMPEKILFVDANTGGPGVLGSIAISKYVASKDCDIVAMQEDFNYYLEIWSLLLFKYNHDEWAGGIMKGDYKVDYAHLHRNKFPTDGLNMSWKRGSKSTAYERIPWEKSFGKFSHEFDDMITKGFRCHEMVLKNGLEVVVYNMHMDASSERDEKAGNDGKDREARLSQWEQLRDYILNRMDQRPVIVVGDMNSLYHRDDVKSVFIDHINNTALATAADAWVDLQLNGQFPPYGQTAIQDEWLDKVIYINPAGTPTPIVPVQAELDTTGYLKDGKPLGDHFPLIVTFAVDEPSAIDGFAADRAVQTDDAPVYTVQGTLATPESKGILIKNGKKYIKSATSKSF